MCKSVNILWRMKDKTNNKSWCFVHWLIQICKLGPLCVCGHDDRRLSSPGAVNYRWTYTHTDTWHTAEEGGPIAETEINCLPALSSVSRKPSLCPVYLIVPSSVCFYLTRSSYLSLRCGTFHQSVSLMMERSHASLSAWRGSSTEQVQPWAHTNGPFEKVNRAV